MNRVFSPLREESNQKGVVSMQEYEIGLYGLGVMGSSLAKNMIQHGFDVALYSKPEAERAAFRVEAPLGLSLIHI